MEFVLAFCQQPTVINPARKSNLIEESLVSIEFGKLIFFLSPYRWMQYGNSQQQRRRLLERRH